MTVSIRSPYPPPGGTSNGRSRTVPARSLRTSEGTPARGSQVAGQRDLLAPETDLGDLDMGLHGLHLIRGLGLVQVASDVGIQEVHWQLGPVRERIPPHEMELGACLGREARQSA